MTTRADLRAALEHHNVRAFLRVIRAGEGTSDPDGYCRHFGGELFSSFVDHPRRPVTKNGYTSTAAGAYQFLSKTWDGLVRQYGFPDFTPASQDEAAVALIIGRKAMPAVLAGRLEEAIQLCNKEWASLPGSPYGQPTQTLAQATEVYLNTGGSIASPRPTEPEPVIPAFVAAALPALIEAAPALIKVFGSDSPKIEKVSKTAEAVATIAMKATGTDTVEGAVKAIQADPVQAAVYREAVHEDLAELSATAKEFARIDEESRTHATDRAIQLSRESGGAWLYLLGAVAVAVVLGSYAIVMLVLMREGFSEETRAMLLGQVVIFGFGTVIVFLFGSNFSNRVDQARRTQE